MTPAVASAGVWLLVLALIAFRRGKDRSRIYAAIAAATGVTLALPPVYERVDGWLGGYDRVHLIIGVIFMVGTFYLSRSVMLVGTTGRFRRPVRFCRLLLSVAVTVTTVGFILIDDRQPISTGFEDFHEQYGGQLETSVYAAAQAVYHGIVLTLAAITAARRLMEGPDRMEAWLVLTLLVGTMNGMGLALVVLLATFARTFGWDEVLEVSLVARPSLFWGTLGGLIIGQVSAPIIWWVTELVDRRRIAARLRALEGSARRAGLDLGDEGWRFSTSDEGASILHRAVVEIRDAHMDARSDFQITDEGRGPLLDAEKLLRRSR